MKKGLDLWKWKRLCINQRCVKSHVFFFCACFRCLRGDWAGMDDPSVYNCSVAVAEARAAK